MKKIINPEIDRLWTRNYIFIMLGMTGISFGNFFFLSTLPIYAERISGTAVYAGLMTGVYTLAALASRPVSGILTDRIGRIRLALIAAILCAVSCLLYNAAFAIFLLILFRIIHGFAFGLHSTAISTAAVDVIPEKRRMEGVGYLGLFSTLASAVAPGIALSLAQNNPKGFNILFFVAGGMAALTFVIEIFIDYEKKEREDNKEDRNTAGTEKNHPKTILGFEPTAFKPALVLFITAIGHGSVSSFIALLAISKGLGNIGLFFTLSAGAMFAARLFAGKIGDKYGTGTVLIPAMVLMIVTLVLIAFANSNIMLVLLGIPYGLVQGVIFPTFNVIIVNQVPKERRGAANSTYYAAIDTGLGIGSICWGFVAIALGSYSSVFYLAALLPLTGLFVYFKLINPRTIKGREQITA